MNPRQERDRGVPDRRDGDPDRRDDDPRRRDGVPERPDDYPERRDGVPERRDGVPDRRNGDDNRGDAEGAAGRADAANGAGQAHPRRRAWAVKLEQAGGSMEYCGAVLGGWHGPIKQTSEFLQQVSGYIPSDEAQCPEMLVRMARACGSVSMFLTHLATAVQGLSAMGRLLGSAVQQFVRTYGLGIVPEAEEEGAGAEDEEEEQNNPVIVNTIEELMEVLVTWRSGAVVRVDVGPEATISLASEVYEFLRMQGPGALELIRDSQNINIKLGQYNRTRELHDLHLLSRSRVHVHSDAQGLATLLP